MGEFATSAVSAVNRQRVRPIDSSTPPLIPSWGGSSPTSKRSTSLVRRHPARQPTVNEGRKYEQLSPLDWSRDREADVQAAPETRLSPSPREPRPERRVAGAHLTVRIDPEPTSSRRTDPRPA